MSMAQSFAASMDPEPRAGLDAIPADSTQASPAALGGPPPLGSRRSPWIAAFLALFPGLGSIYNGAYARGVAFFLSVLGAIHLAGRGNELWGFGVAFLWLFNVVDAYREARLIRAGLAYDRGAARQRPVNSPLEGLGLGALLLAVGLVSLLDVLGYDVEWVFDLWPVALMIAGGWFIFTSIQRLRQRTAP